MIGNLLESFVPQLIKIKQVCYKLLQK